MGGRAATDRVLSEARFENGLPTAAFYEAATGGLLATVPQVIAYWDMLAPHQGVRRTDTLVLVTGGIPGGAQSWSVVDAADGRQVWRVDDGMPAGWDDTAVLTADGRQVVLHEFASGAVQWRTEVDEPGAPHATAVFGEDLVVVDVDRMYGD